MLSSRILNKPYWASWDSLLLASFLCMCACERACISTSRVEENGQRRNYAEAYFLDEPDFLFYVNSFTSRRFRLSDNLNKTHQTCNREIEFSNPLFQLFDLERRVVGWLRYSLITKITLLRSAGHRHLFSLCRLHCGFTSGRWRTFFRVRAPLPLFPGFWWLRYPIIHFECSVLVIHPEAVWRWKKEANSHMRCRIDEI